MQEIVKWLETLSYGTDGCGFESVFSQLATPEPFC